MLALTILLFGTVVLLIMVVVLVTVFGLVSLLSLVVPVVPLLVMIGSALLGLIEMLLFFGGPEDRRLAKRELVYLGMTFAISGVLWWISTHFLWRL